MREAGSSARRRRPGRMQGSQVTCELSKDEVYHLFGELERIQEQLDALA